MNTNARRGSGMRAHAAVKTERRAGAPSRLRRLRSQAPLMLRPTLASGRMPTPAHAPDAAHVALATGAAGPVGGDEYRLDVVVGAHSTLVLTEISATLALPGPGGATSRTDYRVRVEEGGTLIWMPRPLIAAAECRHEHRVDITLASDARLYYRDEILLGRHGEEPGDLDVHLSIQHADAPLLRQHLRFGPGAPGYAGGAVLGGNRAVGSFVIVDPQHTLDSGAHEGDPRSGLLRLAHGGVQGSAVREDGAAVRRALDRLAASLGAPWGDRAASGWSAVP